MRLHDQRRLAALRDLHPGEIGRDHGLDALCGLIRLTLGVPMAAVSLVDENLTHYVGTSGLDVSVAPTADTLCSRVIEEDEPMLVEDAVRDERFRNSPYVIGNPGIRFYLGAPLLAADGSPLGSICGIDTTSRTCTEAEQALLKGLASTATEMLEMRRRMKAVHAMALTDALTGIANRSGIEWEVEKAIAVCARHGLAFSILLFDVDRFKSVNDGKGHEAGDRLLRLIGDTLLATVRREETCGRLGGDEFLVLLSGVTGPAALEAARRIKASLDQAVRAADHDVSFSMGLASFPKAPAGIAEAFGAADTLLYKAKREGKDRIESPPPADGPPET